MKQRKIFKKLVLSLAIFIGVYTGFYSSGKMSIRWIRGWGTSLSGIC